MPYTPTKAATVVIMMAELRITVEAVGGAQGVSDHGQARQGVNDLGEGRFHARSLTGGQDDDGGGARHVPPRGLRSHRDRSLRP